MVPTMECFIDRIEGMHPRRVSSATSLFFIIDISGVISYARKNRFNNDEIQRSSQ